MLKHIPTVPSTTAIGTSSSAPTYAQTPNSRSSRPPPTLLSLNRSQLPLNVSTLTTASNITSNGGPSLLQTYSNTHTTPLLTHTSYADGHAKQNGHIPRMFTPLPTFSSNSQQHLLKGFNSNNTNTNHNHNTSNNASSSTSSSKFINPESNGAREALTSLGLLCLGMESFISFFFACIHVMQIIIMNFTIIIFIIIIIVVVQLPMKQREKDEEM